MMLTGGGAQKVGVAVVDIQTGLYSTIAIQAALIARSHTGRGQYIDMSPLMYRSRHWQIRE